MTPDQKKHLWRLIQAYHKSGVSAVLQEEWCGTDETEMCTAAARFEEKSRILRDYLDSLTCSR